MRRVNPRELQRVARELGEVALDPSAWPKIMEQISAAAGGSGAVLLQSDVRTPDVPRTPSVDALMRTYFADGWHVRDVRAARCVPRLLAGERVVTDGDIFTRDEMRSLGMYNELSIPHGFKWFAAVGFFAGPALWGLSIQRTTKDEPFAPAEARLLATLSDRLSEVATLSTAVGRIALTSATRALDSVGQPAVAVDHFGRVLDANCAAESVLDNYLCIDRCGRLCALDGRTDAALQTLFDRLRATPDTDPIAADRIIVRRAGKAPVVIRVLPIHGAARGPFGGARALLTFSTLDLKAAPEPELVSDIFGLTRAEAEVAAFVAQGKSLAEIAAQRGSAAVTVRNQIRTIFAKTGTHRQSELVALLSRL
jgi:DNA-binding CsgD family transcriptional regulator